MNRVGTLYRLVPWRIALCVIAVCLGLVFVVRTVRHAQALSSCPCHIIPSTDTPTGPAFDDSSPEEFGVRFKTQVNGYITGVRFYKDATMTDTHVGNLWGPTGSLLASANFTGETSSGWQDVSFSSPVQVSAGTVYTASFYTPAGRYMATHSYYASDVSNYPLTAPASGGNGVFATGGDVYPTGSYMSSNYWVDATFRASPNGSAPQVSSSVPANGATSVNTGSNLTATFSHAMDGSTLTTSNVALTDGGGNPVSIAVSYNDGTDVATITPSQPLDQNASYTLSIHGGAGGVTDLDGTPLTTDYQAAFVTGSNTCPCSVWDNAAPSGTAMTTTDANPLELGVSIHANENGYIHAVRFYKPLKSTASSHTVHVWASDGTLLGSGTSSHETSHGWQEVALSAPVAVTQGTNYTVSYYDSDNTYVYTTNGLTSENGTGPLRTNANGGRFTYSGDVFPNSTYTSNYWIDAVFATDNSYTAPFKVNVSQPTAGGYGVKPSDPLTFTLSNAADSATVAGSINLKDTSGATVSGTTTYDDTAHTITFQPSSSLARNERYIATVSTSLHDVYGTPLTAYTASFTTGSALSTDINQGLGGPVLVLTSTADTYGTYLAEMLRAEGINYFTVKDISQISPATLDQYRLVLLAKSSLSAGQVTALSDWVNAGGDLIAMQPDKQLASLLGLTDQNQTLSEGYLKVILPLLQVTASRPKRCSFMAQPTNTMPVVAPRWWPRSLATPLPPPPILLLLKSKLAPATPPLLCMTCRNLSR